MYNYNFESEKILLEMVDNLVTINDKELRINIIITKDNLMLFRNIKDGSILNSRGIHELPEYELLLKMKFNDIKFKVDEANTIINFNNNEIILYNFDFNKVKIGLFCDKNVIS